MSLNKDPDMILTMENDLKQKVQFAIDSNPSMRMVVHGVFSIEDLEQKLESDLGGTIGVGIQYVGCERSKSEAPVVGRNDAVCSVTFSFAIVLAVPATEFSEERINAGSLLTILRSSVLGTAIADDSGQRVWSFVRELAEPSASTPTMLYYSQVWQVMLPIVSNQA